MDLISPQSKDNLERAFQKSARACLARAATDECEIVRAPAVASQVAAGGQLTVVTISSFTFRLLVIFHLRESAQMREYFSGSAAGAPLAECFYEVANMCCGALNREISHAYQHLAMSIPFTLTGACLAHLQELRPQYVCNFLIKLNQSIEVRATLCMCCSAPFEMKSIAPDSQPESGELELL